MASVVHCAWPGSVWQTPFVQIWPVPHDEASVHEATHWLSTQSLPPPPQSLEYWQVLVGAVHEPPEHTLPSLQSEEVAHGQGPLVPPHAWHSLATHTACPVQSVFVVHWIAVPASVPGAVHAPPLQVVPRGQSLVCWQLFTQPPEVQTSPVAHDADPVHAVDEGGVTVLQP